MTDLEQLIDSLRHRPVATTAAQMRLAAATIEAQMGAIENLRAALKTAQLRFEYIAAGVGRPTVDPAVGARECAEALAGSCAWASASGHLTVG